MNKMRNTAESLTKQTILVSENARLPKQNGGKHNYGLGKGSVDDTADGL